MYCKFIVKWWVNISMKILVEDQSHECLATPWPTHAREYNIDWSRIAQITKSQKNPPITIKAGEQTTITRQYTLVHETKGNQYRQEITKTSNI